MASEVDRVMGQLDQFAERVITKLTLDITANLKEATPVDTGWARANWVARIGAPLVETQTPGERTTAAARGREADSQASLAVVLSSYRLEGGAVYISNNVPYISRLNSGSSRKAPAGFVQRAIEKGVTTDLLSLRT